MHCSTDSATCCSTMSGVVQQMSPGSSCVSECSIRSCFLQVLLFDSLNIQTSSSHASETAAANNLELFFPVCISSSQRHAVLLQIRLQRHAMRPTQTSCCPIHYSACGMAVAADGRHGQHCIYSSSFINLSHDSIEQPLHDVVRGGVGHAQRQQRGLPPAGRTVPNRLIRMSNNRALLCDVTVADILAGSSLATAASGLARLAGQAARKKVDKHEPVVDTMRAVHLPFAVETTGALSKSTLQLIRQTHHSAGSWLHEAGRGRHRQAARRLCGHRRAAWHAHGAAGEPGEGAGSGAGSSSCISERGGVSGRALRLLWCCRVLDVLYRQS